MKFFITVFLFAFFIFWLALTLSASREEPKPVVTQEVYYNIGADRYLYEQSDFQATNLIVKIVRVKNEEELLSLRLSFKDGYTVEEGSVLKGFTVYGYSQRNNTSYCTIYIKDPHYGYEPEFIGHELTHCMDGNFHPSQR